MKLFTVRYQTIEGQRRKEGLKTVTIKAKDIIEATNGFLTVSRDTGLDTSLAYFKIGESKDELF